MYGLNGPTGGKIHIAATPTANPRGEKYLESLRLSAELGAFDAQAKRLREQAFGGGGNRPLSLRGAANSSSADCMPPTAPLFQFPKGTIRVGGTEFLVDTGYITTASSMPACPAAPVNARFEAIAVLSACHSAPVGEQVARLCFHYADGSEKMVAFTSGVNTYDWWSGPRAISEGVAAFTQQVEYQSRVSGYAALILNPFPDKEIMSLRFEPVSSSARLVVMAMTGVATLAPAKEYTVATERMGQQLMKLGDEILASYRGIMSADEADEAVGIVLAGRLVAVESIAKGG